MLSENIKITRKSKGLSQEELAAQVHVVRQTVSKWEQGLSVPDADMLIALSEALDAPVGELLGPSLSETQTDGLKAIAEKLEDLNLQIAKRKALKKRLLSGSLALLCALIVTVFAAMTVLDSPYLTWDYSDPETAVIGVTLHAFEWLFVRLAPIVLAVSAISLVLMHRRGDRR